MAAVNTTSAALNSAAAVLAMAMGGGGGGVANVGATPYLHSEDQDYRNQPSNKCDNNNTSSAVSNISNKQNPNSMREQAAQQQYNNVSTFVVVVSLSFLFLFVFV